MWGTNNGAESRGQLLNRGAQGRTGHLLVQRSTDLHAIVDAGDTAKALSQPEHSKCVHFNGLRGEKILAFVSFCAGVFLPLLMTPRLSLCAVLCWVTSAIGSSFVMALSFACLRVSGRWSSREGESDTAG